MDFINARDGWLLTPRDDVYRSADGGKTWIKIGSAKFPGPAMTRPTSIAFLTATTGWITGTNNPRDGTSLLVSHDGGHTWQQPKLPLPPQLTKASLSGESPKLLSAQDGILPIRYETDKGAGVFFCVTHDGGITWTYTTPLTLPSSSSRSGSVVLGYWGSSFADVNHGWVTDADTLYVTSDGGRRWTKIQPSLPFDRPLVGLEFISPRVGWATGNLMEKPFLLKTLDGGRTWTSVPYVILRR